MKYEKKEKVSEATIQAECYRRLKILRIPFAVEYTYEDLLKITSRKFCLLGNNAYIA